MLSVDELKMALLVSPGAVFYSAPLLLTSWSLWRIRELRAARREAARRRRGETIEAATKYGVALAHAGLVPLAPASPPRLSPLKGTLVLTPATSADLDLHCRNEERLANARICADLRGRKYLSRRDDEDGRDGRGVCAA